MIMSKGRRKGKIITDKTTANSNVFYKPAKFCSSKFCVAGWWSQRNRMGLRSQLQLQYGSGCFHSEIKLEGGRGGMERKAEIVKKLG